LRKAGDLNALAFAQRRSDARRRTRRKMNQRLAVQQKTFDFGIAVVIEL